MSFVICHLSFVISQMIIGHQFQWQYLKNLVEMGEISHAYLFDGPKQIGKKKVAIEFIKLLFGPENYQNIEKGIHPDLILIEPERGQIQISQIRELNSRFNFYPLAAPFKVAIIDEAHCMNNQAQSSFLKFLEEPKGKTIFILITPFSKMLLPTVLSRTQIVKFYRVSDSEIKRYLQSQNIAEKIVNEIVEFSEGKPGRAIDFLSNSQKLEKEKEGLQEIIKLTNSDLAFRFQYAKNLSKDSRNLTEVLESWTRHFRKILISRITRPGLVDETRFRSKLIKTLNLIQRINFLISTTNINRRLALEILMLEL